MPWESAFVSLILLFVLAGTVVLVWWRRSALPRAEAVAYLRHQGADLIRLPGRLRQLAADPRTPRCARWLLVALAVYVASPVDPIPDFIPGIGHLDELVIVPLALVRLRRMVPPDVWADHFPPRNHTTPG